MRTSRTLWAGRPRACANRLGQDLCVRAAAAAAAHPSPRRLVIGLTWRRRRRAGAHARLAQGVTAVARALGKHMHCTAHFCAGGTAMREDIARFSAGGVQVVVGTPGRVFDVINHGALCLVALRVLVLDAADEMLSRGFEDHIYGIFRLLPGRL